MLHRNERGVTDSIVCGGERVLIWRGGEVGQGCHTLWLLIVYHNKSARTHDYAGPLFLIHLLGFHLHITMW